MKVFSNPRFLAIYSGVLTLVFAVVVLGGTAMVRNQTFGIITARRINIVEPDGTVRLTISNRADFPGAWNRKKEYPRPDRTEAAGMLFMSEISCCTRVGKQNRNIGVAEVFLTQDVDRVLYAGAVPINSKHCCIFACHLSSFLFCNRCTYR